MIKILALGEDRTHDLQIALFVCDYETDALPTALRRHILPLNLDTKQIIERTQVSPYINMI